MKNYIMFFFISHFPDPCLYPPPYTNQVFEGHPDYCYHYFSFFFFNLQIYFFLIHNDKPKNTNSAVIHKQALYHNTTISLI